MNINVKSDNSVSLFICGDVINEHKRDGLICSPEISDIISSSDYAICNFEAPIDGVGKPAIKAGIHKCQLPQTIVGLKKSGFSLLLLANNHILDYGEQALSATIEMAHASDLETIGAGTNAEVAYRPVIKTLNNIKIGMLNACEAQYGEIDSEQKECRAGYAWINHPVIEKSIINLRKECDFLVVFPHAGLEYYNLPQKEWRARYKLLCDLGADIIIGSHPHVPQGFEKYGKSLIFYSLGNFYFDRRSSGMNTDTSYAIWLNLSRNGGMTFKLIHHYKKNGQVYCATGEKKVNVMQLNELLQDNYYELHDRMVTEVYNKIRRRLAISTFLPVPLNGKFSHFCRLLLSRIIKGSKIRYKDLNLLHLLKNETYLYVIKNALEILTESKYSQEKCGERE